MFITTTLSTLAIVSTFGSSFNYEDLNWGTADNFCGAQYRTQSPINIITSTAGSCPASSKALNWKLNAATNYDLKNTGHSLQVIPSMNDVTKLSNQFNTKYSEFCLGQFHIHWGAKETNHGTEHTINGGAAALEMHFVHYACQYGSVSNAVSEWEKDQSLGNVLAVVAVLYSLTEDVTKENMFLKHMIDHAYYVQNHGVTKALPGSTSYSMNMLVPSNMNSFYHYKGSLTTPGCNPVVDWFVLSEPMYVTEDQLNELRTKMYDEHEKLMDRNWRPVQTNTNPVYFCNVSGDDNDDDKESE